VPETTNQEALPIAARLSRLARSDVEPDEFFKEFFRILYAGMAAEGGSLWLYEPKNRQLVPKAAHLPADGPLSDLSEENITRIIYRTIEQKQPVLYYPEQGEEVEGLRDTCLMAVPVEIDDNLQSVVMFARRKRDNATYAREDVHTLQSLCVYLVVYFANLRLHQAHGASQRLAKFAEIESELAAADNLERMAFTLANRVREMVFFDRAFVALPVRTGFRIAAISGSDDVPQQGATVQNLRQLVREVARIGGDWHFTPTYLEQVEDYDLQERLRLYFETTDYRSVLLMRMEDDDGLLAVMGFERRAQDGYSQADFAFVQSFCRASSRALRRALELDKMPGITLARKARAIKQRVTGSGRLGFFVKIGLAAAAIILLAFGRWNLAVKGDCRLLPRVTAYAAARYQGKIEELLKTEGDSVTSGEAIALMDEREIRNAIRNVELQIRLKEAEGDIKLAADPDTAGLVLMEIDILQTGLESHQLQLEGMKITSPIEGVIITPREQLNTALNSVMNPGELLCEVADTSLLVLEVEVLERDIRFVEEGQPVNFALRGAPNVVYRWRVEKISPSTRAMAGRNVFIVRCLPVGEAGGGALRAGVTGSASIDAGQRHVLYVLFRTTIERFRAFFL
jgi:hypothetical protein